MYVQPPDRLTEREALGEVIIPKNYSGNAFRQYGRGDEAERSAPPPHDPPKEAPPSPPPDPPSIEAPTAEPSEQDGEAAPVWKDADCDEGARGAHAKRNHEPDCHHGEQEKRGGLLSRFPFLSSLLPPSRGKHKKDGILPEWVVIAAVILLFFSEDGDNDILPFLLLLLLWD